MRPNHKSYSLLSLGGSTFRVLGGDWRRTLTHPYSSLFSFFLHSILHVWGSNLHIHDKNQLDFQIFSKILLYQFQTTPQHEILFYSHYKSLKRGKCSYPLQRLFSPFTLINSLASLLYLSYKWIIIVPKLMTYHIKIQGIKERKLPLHSHFPHKSSNFLC